jgi:group I intron endonuclease
MIKNNIFQVYVIVNKVNGKMYVGATENTLEFRYKGHLNKLCEGSERTIYCAMRKHGVENFEIRGIEEYKSKEDMFKGEIEWIAYLDTYRSQYGYNETKGGEGGDTNGGKVFNNEWRKNMSKSAAGKPKLSKRRFSQEIEKEICDLYANQKKTTYWLANKYDCYRTLIKDILIRNNVGIRVSNYTGHDNGCKVLSDEDEKNVCRLYTEEKLTRNTISEKLNIKSTTVRSILLRNNIKL